MKYISTFYTHYGAIKFQKHCKKTGIPAKMAPVPRELSASCGVCVYFEGKDAPKVCDHEDMEMCYIIGVSEGYTPVE